jgi:hypothetical protein
MLSVSGSCQLPSSLAKKCQLPSREITVKSERTRKEKKKTERAMLKVIHLFDILLRWYFCH